MKTLKDFLDESSSPTKRDFIVVVTEKGKKKQYKTSAYSARSIVKRWKGTEVDSKGDVKLVDVLHNGKSAMNEDEDPCWDGYKQLGTKEKNGKTVPNCVKAK